MQVPPVNRWTHFTDWLIDIPRDFEEVPLLINGQPNVFNGRLNENLILKIKTGLWMFGLTHFACAQLSIATCALLECPPAISSLSQVVVIISCGEILLALFISALQTFSRSIHLNQNI